jgi:hypothetical protein
MVHDARDTHADLDAGRGYAAQLETLRSAAKWLLAAAAGVGALLIAGLQLTGIGQLPPTSWRLYTALGAALLTLSTIGYMIKVASTVLTQEWLTLADFTDEAGGLPGPWGKRSQAAPYLRRIEKHLTGARHELFGHAAATLADLHRGLQECHEAIWSPGLDNGERQQAAERSGVLRAATRNVVQAANYYYVLQLFKGLRVRMAWATAIGVAGIAVFAYVVNPPEHPKPVEVRIVAIRPAFPGAIAG